VKNKTPSTRTLAGIAAVASLSLAAFAVFLQAGGGGADALTDCSLLGATDEGYECMETYLADRIGEEGIASADAELDVFLTTYPEYNGDCHRAGHAAGEKSFTGIESLITALESLEHDVCESALLHGVIDGWALTEESGPEWDRAVEACESARERWPRRTDEHDVLGRCADGLGHAAYVMTGSPAICAAFTTYQGQRECGGGVVMQFYLPVRLPEGHTRPSYADLVDLCLEWPADVVTADGCYHGIGYGLREIAAEALFLWIESRGGPEDERKLSDVVEAYTEALSYCRDFETYGQLVCEEGVLLNLPGTEILRQDPDAISRLCRAHSPPLRDRCITGTPKPLSDLAEAAGITDEGGR